MQVGPARSEATSNFVLSVEYKLKQYSLGALGHHHGPGPDLGQPNSWGCNWIVIGTCGGRRCEAADSGSLPRSAVVIVGMLALV